MLSSFPPNRDVQPDVQPDIAPPNPPSLVGLSLVGPSLVGPSLVGPSSCSTSDSTSALTPDSSPQARRADAAHESREIGLIGLGLVGTALTARWLAAGRVVVGFDLSPDRRCEFQQAGGVLVESSREVLRRCRATVLSLPDSTVVAGVLDESIPVLAAGALVIDTTTGAPSDSQRQAARLRAARVGFVDATLVGSSLQIAEGRAIALMGGDATEITSAEAIMREVAERVFWVGPSGAGARLKLVVNLVLGLHRAVLAEGLALAEAAGFDLDKVLEVLQASPAASRIMDAKGPLMVRGDFRPQARLAQHRKDVQLIADLAASVGQSLPLTDAHARLLDEALRRGWGELDNSAVVQVYRETLRE